MHMKVLRKPAFHTDSELKRKREERAGIVACSNTLDGRCETTAKFSFQRCSLSLIFWYENMKKKLDIEKLFPFKGKIFSPLRHISFLTHTSSLILSSLLCFSPGVNFR